MKINPKEAFFAQKYRPQTIDEMILPDTYINKFKRYINNEINMPPLLLHGNPGCGKTTIAKLFDPIRSVFTNASDENTIHDIRNLIAECSAATPWGRRIIIFDEGDNLAEGAQLILRGAIEKLSYNNDFIMTANHIEMISDALISRFHLLDFNFEKDSKLLKKAEKRVLEILEHENIKNYDIAAIRNIIRMNFPDMRKILNIVQHEFV